MIALSPLTAADAADHLAGEDDELIRWLSGGPSTPEGLDAYLGYVAECWALGGPLLAFGIRVLPGGDLAGTVDIWRDQPYLAAAEVNLAYGLYPQWRGGGLATRAVLLVFGHLRTLPGIERAVIRADPANAASAAVARRAGFAYLNRIERGGAIHDWYVRDV